ncbi:MAG: hypothetical protein JST43_02160 [Bacteroidetes bacterium]|nr:hypothetical protein [Bacteroidota bacterium]MBS1539992.1 hypothetical protein [Bacteroidota bacterium]
MNNLTLFVLFIGLISCTHSRYYEKREPNYDSLRIVLDKMWDRDQHIRRVLIDSIRLSSPPAEIFIKRMRDVDQENQKELQIILDRFGWIPQSKIGEGAAGTFFIVIQHSDTSVMAKWFPVFKSLAEKGEANRMNCATMEDRLLMWRGKKQIYGTQATSTDNNKTLFIWPIENPQEVNARRKKIGFETTVEENAKNLGASYNPDEKLPPIK